MAWSVVNDGFSGTGHFRDGCAIADGGLEDDGPVDRREEYRRVALRLAADDRVLASVDKHGHLRLRCLLGDQVPHETRRRREVERRRPERDQDRVRSTQHRPREPGRVVLLGHAWRTVDEDQVLLGPLERRETPLELTPRPDFERQASLPSRQTPHGGTGLRIGVDDEDGILGSREASREIHGGGGLSAATLLVRNSDDDWHEITICQTVSLR